MQRIKILTDSACDIPFGKDTELGILIKGFCVTVDGKSYIERRDFNNVQFYKMLEEAREFPKTAQITAYEFHETYKELCAEGYTDVIHVTISSTGSGTYNNALLARDEFYEDNGDKKMKIHIVDSLNYTGVYGYPVIQAAMKVQKGAKVDEILSFLEDWFSSAEVLFSAYTLEYTKRSGRISAAAAFAGELLGLRPIIRISDGVSHVIEKVRGDKNIIPKLIDITMKTMIPHTPYLVMRGCPEEPAEELAKALTKKLGYPPEYFCDVGASVASNCGPRVTGVVLKTAKRR